MSIRDTPWYEVSDRGIRIDNPVTVWTKFVQGEAFSAVVSFSSAWRRTSSVIWPASGKMTGFLRLSERLAFFIRPPTLNNPLASRYGSRVLRLLPFFKTAFLSISWWRSLGTLSVRVLKYFRILISSWNLKTASLFPLEACLSFWKAIVQQKPHMFYNSFSIHCFKPFVQQKP